jgi:hypothetical protein
MMAYIVVRKWIGDKQESTTIDGVYSTREEAFERTLQLAKKTTYHNIRLHVVAKQIKGKVNEPQH